MATAAEKAAAKAAKDAEKAAAKGGDFGFAVNLVKLNRAKAWVRAMRPETAADEFEAAVKARYIEMGGLVADEGPQRVSKKASAGEENMAVNDED